MTVLKVENVSVSLGGKQVLRDINLTARAGQFIGLIGPNGAGKTTLIRSVNNLIPLDSGQITLSDGAEIGYVPQYRNITWDYPVSLEQVVMTSFAGKLKLWSRPTKAQWEAVYHALDHVGLLDLRHRTLAELSGGQKQRVLLARALAVNPSLLLLDEPFTGLDHPHQDSLAELFRELADSGVAIIMSTHDLNQAVDICSDFAMLNRSLRAIGRPHDLVDAELWMETYEVSRGSALLRSLEMINR